MTLLGARAPARAPGVELLGELTGSGYAATPGLVRRTDGQTVQLTPLLYCLLENADGTRDLDQLAEALGRSCGKAVAAEDVAHLLEHKLAPLGLLSQEDGSAPVTDKPAPLLGLKLKVVVSDPAITRRLTAPFTWLFRTGVVVPVLVAFAVTCWWVLWEKGLAQATRQAFYEPGLLLAVFALTVLSAGFHEFGHAAACRAAGARPGAMGAGLYLVWPAFYTDVDDSYRLSRWGRLKVDLGGLYFNAIVAVAVTALWWLTRQDALLLGVATQLLQMVRQLAPVIRADGYHILADLTGVPDLFAHLKPTLLGLLPSRWGRPQPLQRWARVVVTTWVLVVVPVLLGLLVLGVLLLPRLLATAADGLRVQGAALSAAAQEGDVLQLLARLLAILALVVPVSAIVYLLTRVVRRTAVGVWRTTQDRPRARAAAIVAGGVLLALLAWSWWPAGQYQPVRQDERGSLGGIVSVTAQRAVAPQPVGVQVPEGAVQQTALALVPQGAAAATEPTVLLLRQDDGSLRSILAGADGSGVSFPFALPEAPGEGDNQALAVNDQDGTTVYEVAVALVWVQDGAAVGNRNEAYALASCRACTTVAVAFQVVLAIGQTDVVAPVNAAVAANGGCVQCVTSALAVQLVATLKQAPSEQVQQQLEQALAQLGSTSGGTDIYEQVTAVEQQILRLLEENDLIEPPTPRVSTSPDPVASPSRSSSSAPSPVTGGSPAPAASGSSRAPSAAPTPEPAAEPTPEPASSSAPSEEPMPSPSS